MYICHSSSTLANVFKEGEGCEPDLIVLHQSRVTLSSRILD